MHSIDRNWTDIAAGYQAIQLLQARLETEFGRAVQASYKHKFNQELTGWQKKRRVFFVMTVIALLSIITLCLTAFYFREVACVIVYWTLLVAIILVTLAVAGRNFIRDMMNRPSLENVKSLAVNLEQRWWDCLSPQERSLEKTEDDGTAAFLTALGQALPETCLATRAPGLLLFSPAGLWLFQIETWSGTIIRQEGAWKQIQTVRDKFGRKQNLEQMLQAAPDNAWLQRKNELVGILHQRQPQRAWTETLIQGGVVFTHPKASLDKPRIQGNTAAYGTPKGWIERIRRASPVEGFSLEIQLEILESLHQPEGEKTTSARELAGQLYQAAADELRLSIAKMVN
jgi:hypothetical protein